MSCLANAVVTYPTVGKEPFHRRIVIAISRGFMLGNNGSPIGCFERCETGRLAVFHKLS